jgi:hypothetical protein
MGTPRPKAHVYKPAANHELPAADPRISEIRNRLGVSAQAGVFGAEHFNWEQATLVEYEKHIQDQETDHLIVAPPPAFDDPLKHTFLISPTSNATPFGGIGFVALERDDAAVTDRFRAQFVDSAGRPIVGMDINAATSQIQPIIHVDQDQPEVTGNPAYWGCMKQCMKTLWPTLPWPIQLIASTACGTCFTAPNPAACSACVGAVGGYAVNCMKKCQHLG